MIELTDVRKTYRMGGTDVQALRGISLTIAPGEFVAITGASGSGKSTLMHVIGLLDVPDAGSYRLDGRRVIELTPDELAVLRRERIGFIFQQFHLLPRTTAAENVALPLLYSRHHTDLAAARALLARVGLAERTEHRPNELSGGQQQRVAIARALINQPRLLLADEPTGNLDSATRAEIMGLLQDLNRDGITVILVTHEPEIARMAPRCIRMRDGCVESDLMNRISEPNPGVLAAHTSYDRRWPWDELLQHVRQGMRALAANKVRSALSVLGILIGVAAVVAVLAIGRGAQQAIEQQLAALGSNLLVLRPGAIRVGGVAQEAGGSPRFTIDDATAIKARVSGVREIGPGVWGRAQVTYANRNWNTQVLGTTESHPSLRAAQPVIGRFFTEQDNNARSRVVVLGVTPARELFGDESPIGHSVKLNRVSFQVIGLLPEKGMSGFRDQDDLVVIPLFTAMHRLLGKDYLDTIDIQADSPQAIAPIQEAVRELMGTRHRVAPAQRKDAYQIRNLADVQAALEESSRTMSQLLSAIAAISLLVGGIGIMNIMLVSVTERTREIGLRKAVGARAEDIQLQFLIEAVVVSALGGVAGVLFGGIAAAVMAYVTDWHVVVDPSAVALAFAFSAAIGVIFGLYPARRAAALNPIEALRYE